MGSSTPRGTATHAPTLPTHDQPDVDQVRLMKKQQRVQRLDRALDVSTPSLAQPIIWVAGFPEAYTQADLLELFSSRVGRVTAVELYPPSKNQPRYPHTHTHPTP